MSTPAAAPSRSRVAITTAAIIIAVLVILFFVSGADANTFVLSMLSSKGTLFPRRSVLTVWGVLTGVSAILLLLVGGLAALRILAGDSATAHIPVVALSANAMPRDIEKGLEAGFFRYLTKPIKVTEFMQTLDLALQAAPTTTGTAT